MTYKHEERINELKHQIELLEKELKAQPTKTTRWKPSINEKYGHINSMGVWDYYFFLSDARCEEVDRYRFSIGNCYPYTPEGKEQAIWEQVTRRRYDQQLRDAADWAGDGECYEGIWDGKEILTDSFFGYWHTTNPRFDTHESCLEAHTRILGTDAKRYFTGEK